MKQPRMRVKRKTSAKLLQRRKIQRQSRILQFVTLAHAYGAEEAAKIMGAKPGEFVKL